MPTARSADPLPAGSEALLALGAASTSAMPSGLVAVAASGGLDSSALLHCTARLARDTDLEVLAFHVHHGLQPDAERWLDLLRERCRRWRSSGLPVRFAACRLQGQPVRGESVEAWARRERYRALAAMARDRGCGVVLLGHHLRDQAETFVLQALRGGGAAALASMPRAVERDGILWLRPWLGQPRAVIEAYARRHRLGFVDDPSNADPRFSRSRLRQRVWPALIDAFSDAEASLASSAARLHETQQALDDYVAADLAGLVEGGVLQVDAWLALPAARQPAVLRAWLDRQLPAGTPGTLFERLLRELPVAASASRWPSRGGELALHRGRLEWLPAAAATSSRADSPVRPRLDLTQPGVFEMPGWGGAFHVRRGSGGLAAAALRDVVLKPRSGGERFALAAAACARSLKKQYQALGVPAWQRGGPLLWRGDELLYVPGLGIEGKARARHPGDLLLEWVAAH